MARSDSHTVDPARQAISRETGDNIDEKAAQACGVSRLLYAGDQYKANPAAWDDLKAPHHIEMSNIRTSKYGSRARQITSNQTRFEARYFNQIGQYSIRLSCDVQLTLMFAVNS